MGISTSGRVIDMILEQKSPWTASQFWRRFVCTGSGQMEEGLPDVPEPFQWSEVGVNIHVASAEPGRIDELDEPEHREMAREMSVRYREASAWAEFGGGKSAYEHSVEVRDKDNRAIGTGRMDFFAFNDNERKAVIWDLKTGWGSAEDQAGFWGCQGEMYAMGLMQEFADIDSVVVFFHQGAMGKSWRFEIQRGKLPALLLKYRKAYRRKWYPKLTLTPNAVACRFCKARPTCGALRSFALRPSHYADLRALIEDKPRAILPAADLNDAYEIALVARQYVNAVLLLMRARAAQTRPCADCGGSGTDRSQTKGLGDDGPMGCESCGGGGTFPNPDPDLDWALEKSADGNREIESAPALWAMVKPYLSDTDFYKAVKVVPGKMAKLIAGAIGGRGCDFCEARPAQEKLPFAVKVEDPVEGDRWIECAVCNSKGTYSTHAAAVRAFWRFVDPLVTRGKSRMELRRKVVAS